MRICLIIALLVYTSSTHVFGQIGFGNTNEENAPVLPDLESAMSSLREELGSLDDMLSKLPEGFPNMDFLRSSTLMDEDKMASEEEEDFPEVPYEKPEQPKSFGNWLNKFKKNKKNKKDYMDKVSKMEHNGEKAEKMLALINQTYHEMLDLPAANSTENATQERCEFVRNFTRAAKEILFKHHRGGDRPYPRPEPRPGPGPEPRPEPRPDGDVYNRADRWGGDKRYPRKDNNGEGKTSGNGRWNRRYGRGKGQMRGDYQSGSKGDNKWSMGDSNKKWSMGDNNKKWSRPARPGFGGFGNSVENKPQSSSGRQVPSFKSMQQWLG